MCSLWLSGEWGWGITVAQGCALAEDIPGSNFTVMEGLGHYPMCENPEQFRRYLIPILERIK